MQVALRNATAEDVEFCKRLYIDGMLPVMTAFAGWDANRLEKNFTRYFNLTCVRIIEMPQRCGWLQLEEKINELLISFLYLESASRRLGIGTQVIAQCIQDAKAGKKMCAIRCVKTNEGALRLYKSLGFRIVSEDNLKYFMEHA
jgi:ribosomal protein S18 acetylase RimI-like enzyme